MRGFALPLLLLIILLVLLTVAGVFYFKTPKTIVNYRAPEVSESKVLAGSSPAQESDDLLGIKFDLPKGYKLVRESEEEYFKRANGNIRKNFSGYILYPPADFAEAFYIVSENENNLDNSALSVWVFKNTENFDAKKFYKQYWYYPFVWGDFTSASEKIAPKDIELIGGKEGVSGIVDYRPGKQKYIYLPLNDINLMIQIQFPSEDDLIGKEILKSFKFE